MKDRKEVEEESGGEGGDEKKEEGERWRDKERGGREVSHL